MSGFRRIITDGNFSGSKPNDIRGGGVWTVGHQTKLFINFNPANVIRDFEGINSLASDWTTSSGIGLDTTRTVGNQSIVFTNSTNIVEARLEPSQLSGGVQIKEFEIYYNENGNSNGAVAYLEDPNGNFILGVGTNNPQVHVWRGESSQNTKVGRLDTGVWVRARLFNINWSTGDFDYEFDNQSNSGIEISGSDTMDNPTSVSSLVLSPTDFNDSPAPNSGSSAAGNHWWDNISILTET